MSAPRNSLAIVPVELNGKIEMFMAPATEYDLEQKEYI
jgi:hypothetical protein